MKKEMKVAACEELLATTEKLAVVAGNLYAAALLGNPFDKHEKESLVKLTKKARALGKTLAQAGV